MPAIEPTPITFEQYLATRNQVPGRDDVGTDCTCCGEAPAISRDGYCKACLRYQYGFDQAARQVASGVFAGAVKAALAAGLTGAEIAAMVQAALESEWSDELAQLLRLERECRSPV